MYEFDERVRYSETTERGICSVLALVNYLQDCSTFHSEDAGVGVSYLQAAQRAWLLSYWDIYIDRFPRLCERIVVGTCPHEIKGVMAYRNFWIREDNGIRESEPRYLVRAESIWFNLNLQTGKPGRIDPAEVAPYGEVRDVLGLPRSSRKISLPEVLTAGEMLVVQPHHIDSNHHMNNAQYIAIAAEVVQDMFPDIGVPKRIRAEYKQAAVLHEEMIPYIGRTQEGIVVSLKNKNGETYANVEFR